jgi:hypothetical protein
MGLFGKKKIQLTQDNFTEWEKEMGFLFVKMQRKKNIIKSFFIEIYDTQLVKDTDYIRDEDIIERIERSVYEVFTEIGGRYRNHLIDKYFGSEIELIKFITEDFYVDLTSAAVNKNNAKIRMKAVYNKLDNFRKEETNNKEDKKE